MFEFLVELPANQLVGGVYYAVREIKHVKHIKKPLPLDDLLKESKPSSSQEDVKAKIIQQIEQTESLSLKSIPTHVLGKYIQILAKQLQILLKDQLRYDERRGDELLRQLRKDM